MEIEKIITQTDALSDALKKIIFDEINQKLKTGLLEIFRDMNALLHEMTIDHFTLQRQNKAYSRVLEIANKRLDEEKEKNAKMEFDFDKGWIACDDKRREEEE